MPHDRGSHWRRPPGSPKGAAKTVYVRGTTVNDATSSGDGDGSAGCCCCMVVIIGLVIIANQAGTWAKDLFEAITN